MATQKEVTVILAPLFVLFNKEADKARLTLYGKYLQPFPIDLLEKAVDKIILTSKFLPTVADIVEEVKSLDNSTKPISDDWDEAWRIINREMYRCAATDRKPNFEGNEAIEVILPPYAFHELCMTLEKDMPIVKAQLREMYKTAKARLANKRKNNVINQAGEPMLVSDKVLEIEQ